MIGAESLGQFDSLTGHLYAVGGPGSTLYYAHATAAPASDGAHSQQRSAQGCAMNIVTSQFFVPAIAVDLGAQFTPPFTVAAK